MPRLSAAAIAFAIMASSVTSLSATKVVAPTFEELLRKSEVIVVSDVLDRTSRWQRMGTRNVIVTDVRVRVTEVLKGRTDVIRTLRILGGTIGDVTQYVPGAPLFVVGDRDVLFLRERPDAVSPVVGMFHGRFRVVTGHNGAGDFIANHARQPIARVQDFARPQRLGTGQRPLSLTEFVRTIRAALAR
jgi:hypothetical protein